MFEAPLTDEKYPQSTSNAVKPDSESNVAPAPTGPEADHSTAPDMQEATVDELLQGLLEDTDRAALYNLLSVC
jgi:hypothetical protein